jgi:hypothetical protein
MTRERIDWGKVWEIARHCCAIDEPLKIWQAANVSGMSEAAFRAALEKDGCPEGWLFDPDVDGLWPSFDWSSLSFNLEKERDALVQKLKEARGDMSPPRPPRPSPPPPLPDCPVCRGQGCPACGGQGCPVCLGRGCPACATLRLHDRRSKVCDYCGQPLAGDECETEYGDHRMLTVCSRCRGGQR